MATITEDYVSFEVAKLLEEKGFDEYCPKSYFKMDKTLKESGFSEWEKVNEIKAPTQSLAMKWLREVHNLFIQICIIPHTTITMEQKYYFFTIHKDRRTLAFRKDFPSEHYSTYEEACETAIKYCMENLI